MRENTLFKLKVVALIAVAAQFVDGWVPTYRSVALASEATVKVLDTYEKALNAQAEKIVQLPKLSVSKACEDRYEHMWADGQLRIDFFYGYLGSDDHPVVADRLMRYTMVHQLTKPCSAGLGACGFEMVQDLSESEGPYVLKKKSERGDIVLSIWDSAHENWRTQNTVGVGNFFVSNKSQKKKTEKVWDAYLKSYREANIVIYDGHSELGTGPGFKPMGLLQFSTARFLKQNLVRFKRGMKSERTHEPSVIFLAACESKKYYLKDYRRLFPEAALVLTDHNQQFQSGEQAVFGFLDSIVGNRCSAEIDKALEPTGYPDAGTHVYGFD